MFDDLKGVPRLLMEVDLKPVQGDRFQPTGFADIGHARYDLPDGTRMLLVETAQSMANRLEQVCLDSNGELLPEFHGLSYVKVELKGDSDAVTSSLVEAHRINSPFIMNKNSGFPDRFARAAGYKKGQFVSWPQVARALFRFDVNSLLHGAFLANFEDGRIRVPRALTSFIEARNVREAVSGGVKNSPLDPTGKLRAVTQKGEAAKDVYSNVPYHRIEYTAERIVSFFNLDLSLLRGYGLPQEAYELLVVLALIKITRLLKGGLRLRTACDLKPVSELITTLPAGLPIPSEEALIEMLRSRIQACSQKGLFETPPVTALTCKVQWSKGKEEESAEE